MAISGSVTVGGTKYNYSERSFGSGRGVLINQHEYMIKYKDGSRTINVHEWSDYNKRGNQPKIYAAAANAIAGKVHGTTWPNKFEFTYDSSTFVADPR
jgi:hypothetical protein